MITRNNLGGNNLLESLDSDNYTFELHHTSDGDVDAVIISDRKGNKLLKKFRPEEEKKHINESYIIGIDISDDIATLTVGKQTIDSSMEIVNTITGPEAVKLYERFLGVNDQPSDKAYMAQPYYIGYTHYPPKPQHIVNNIVLNSIGDAEEVLYTLHDLLNKYGFVTLVDLYDMVGINGDFRDTKYGWKNLRNASWFKVRNGYKLNLPKPILLD
jgi:hypothetical protein